MIKRFKESKGFTLVELIVVIAIVAILAAVSIVGFSGYIDNARFSNDNQLAVQMSRLLENHLITNPSDDFDAHDIRTILNALNGEELDFTPTSSDAGYFYIADTQTIVVAKYEDVLDSGIQLYTPVTELLNQELNASTARSPEEIFAEDQFLLTSDGSIIAEVVSGLRNLATTNDLVSAYSNLYDLVNDPGFFTSLIRDTRFDDQLNDLLLRFHPDNTLFVSDGSWNTSADSADTITTIVFAPGITNIPSFSADVAGLHESVTEIPIPSTVRSIQSGAFKDSIFSGLSIVAPSSSSIGVNSDAFLQGESLSGGTTYDLATSITDYSVYVQLRQSGSGIEFDFELLPIRDSITGYASIIHGSSYEISIFTDEGLIGIASGTLTIYYVNYIRNLPTDEFNVRLYYYESPIDYFRDIPGTFKTFGSYTFTGWYLDESCDPETEIDINDPLSSTSLTVYAGWE